MTRNSEPFKAEAALAHIQALEKKLEEEIEALNSEPFKDEAALARLQALQKKLEEDKEAIAHLQALEKKLEEEKEARKLAEEKLEAQKKKLEDLEKESKNEVERRAGQVLEKIDESFPTDVVHAYKFAVSISGYLLLCFEKLVAENTKGSIASEGQSPIMTLKPGDEQEDHVADSKEDKDDHIESHDADAE